MKTVGTEKVEKNYYYIYFRHGFRHVFVLYIFLVVSEKS